MTDAIHRIRRAAVLIGGVFCVSVVGHYVLHDGTWLEAIFWTIVTISTVGYSYETPASISPTGQLFSVGVIIVGTVSVAYALSIMLQAVIEGQIERAMGVRRMTKQVDKLSDHTIICGFGRIGQNLAARLHEQGVPFVVVEFAPETLSEAAAHDYLVLEGDATDEDVLRQAGIERAKTIVVALQTDADNVFLTLTARNMNPDLRILARGELPRTERKLRQAGANEVVLPAVIGAHRIADLIVRPHATDLLHRVGDSNSGLEAVLEEIDVPPQSELVGKTIRDAETHRLHRLLIVSVRHADGGEVFNPDAEYVFAEGDTLIAMGEPADIREFRRAYLTDSAACSR